MDTIANLKEQAVAQTPLLLFDLELADGSTERLSTHAAVVDSETYEARILRHNAFEVQAAAESGIDAVPRISVTLANADSRFSQIESAVGFKGARVTATFLFYDLIADVPASETSVVFQGILNPPDEISEQAFRLTAVNRMNMQRVLLPTVRIERRCPWAFPSTEEERQEAVGGGSEGIYSRFHRCGYSAGEVGGVGNLDVGAVPFTGCSFTRADCVERGMFDQDSTLTTTRRFGGIEFVPASILVRSHGEKNRQVSAPAVNEARYNDFVPLLYGTVWIEPPVVFSRNDGNLTRMEVLVASGKINRILKVLVNDVEIPAGVSGQDMTRSGWWNLFAAGGRVGGFNLNFTDASGSPLGDPYGSMACLSIVVPNQISDGGALPNVKLLAEGLQLESFDGAGASLGSAFTENPVWILLDVLRHGGWKKSEIDLISFADAAAFCDQTIAAIDNQGNPISAPRFQCNLVVRSRRTAADLIRSIRNNARLQLTYREDGMLSVFVENSISLQQPDMIEGSNATTMQNGGWPAYVYADASLPGVASGILRREDASPAIRLWSRSIADTPNRFSVEFADRFNEYQQDSLDLEDADDIARTGQEISGRLVVDGLPTFDQTARILKFYLDKSIKGNRFVELETTVKGLGQRVGDIVTVTYAKEGLLNQPFRILKIEPSGNYRSVRITAQIHDDAWYDDTNGQLTLVPATQRLPGSETRLPDSISGDEVDEFGDAQFSISEQTLAGDDGTLLTEVQVGFRPPESGQSFLAGTPIVDLTPAIQTSGGTIDGDQTLYYSLTGVDAEAKEGRPSFNVRAVVPGGTSTNQVVLGGLSFTSGTASFNVYRGSLPSQLHRIAETQPLATSFTDNGLAEELQGAPDPQYDHANFYWRIEQTDEQFASVFSQTTIGSSILQLNLDELVGSRVRLLRGKGAGQEREIIANDATTLTVEPKWTTEPDQSTIFAVSESAWHFGSRAQSSPAHFQVPNLGNRVIQITGRAANARNVESLEGLAIVTRWRIGGGSLGVADIDVPPEPIFGFSALGDGNVEIGAIGFLTLENTQTISDATFQIYYRDELAGQTTTSLSGAIDSSQTTLTLNQDGGAAIGDLIQIEAEILRVTEVQGVGTQYAIDRGVCDSIAAAHADATQVYLPLSRIVTASFERGFFGTSLSGSWRRSVWLPDVRVACAELKVVNSFGESPTAVANFSELADNGLRTLRGGQFNFQIEGLMAVLNNATPVLSVQSTVSIRDIFARVKQAPTGADLQLRVNLDGSPIATLSVAAGSTTSAAVNGAELPTLTAGGGLTLDILAVGSTFAGSDVTVTIRV